MKKLIGSFLLVGFLAAGNLVHAQTYWLQSYSHNGSLGAPYPFDPYGGLEPMVVLDATNRIYFIEDDADDFAAMQSFSRSMSMETVDGLFPTNVAEPNFTQWSAPTNGELWLQITNLSDMTTFLKLSNTVADIKYEIQYKTDLVQTVWQSANWFVLGDELTNWTPFSVTATGATNLFMRVRSWVDTYGIGIPDWWQEQYFGTNGIDPYADPDGDGYNNLEEYLNGTDPTVFDSPKDVSNVSANFDPNNTNNVVVSWQGNSSATNYTVTRTSGTNVTSYTVSGTSFTDTGAPAGSTYTVTANYSSGSSSGSTTADPAFDTVLAIDPEVVRGATPTDSSLTSLQIILGGTVSTNVAAIRVHKIVSPLFYNYQFGDYDWGLVLSYGDLGWSESFIGFLDDGSFDVPISSFVNGIYQIPVSQLPEWTAYYLGLQPIDGNGHGGATNAPVFARNVPFVDGSSVLKNNLSFILRSAQADNSGNDISIRDFEADYNYAAVSPMIQHMDVSPDLVTEVAPYNDNWFMRNWNYDTDFDEYDISGTNYFFFWWNKNLGPFGGYFQDLTNGFPEYQFDGYTYVTTQNSSLLANQLTSDFTFLALDVPSAIGYTNDEIPFAGLSWDNDNHQTDFTSGWQNHFGLAYQYVRITVSTNPLAMQHDMAPGDVYSDPSPDNYSEYFQKVTAPSLSTVNYYFAQAGDPTDEDANTVAPMPNDGIFVVTNTTPLIITAVGQPALIYGWAKQQISNGDSMKFGYLGQYFDPTSVANGILSEYGDFFAMQPGTFTLKTKADPDQSGLQGSCTVYAMSMNVDANHDGVMDLTYQGQDTTSENQPMVFWVNDDNDWSYFTGDPGKDVKSSPNYSDYDFQKISSQRDLEDYARLWICGVPSLPSGQGYTVALSWQNTTGSPAVNLVKSVEADGGIGYLTNVDVAAEQVAGSTSSDPSYKFARVISGQPYIFSDDFFDGANKHLLFEGAGIGKGELVMTIKKNGDTVAKTSVWLDLRDVKDLYEQAHIANVATTFPAMVNTTNTSTFVPDNAVPQNPNEAKQLIVLVHGWRMGVWDYRNFSDTMFKRLYWAGYHGRFASLRWPTLSADDFKALSDLQSYTTYNRSEHIAFDSGAGTCAYFDWLKSRLPDYSIGVAAHSMGNVVMAEALKDQLAEGHHVIDNYVMMQAAITAHCYDTALPDYSVFTTAENTGLDNHTSDIYRGYPGNISAAVNNQIVNFFNTNDFALATGTEPIIGNVSWEHNEVQYKPDGVWGYTSDGTNCYIANPTLRVVTNPHEQMAFVARPRAKAAGAQSDVGGVVQTSEQVNLTSTYNFRGNSDEHSAEFNWTFQQLGGTTGFYKVLIQKLSQ